MFEFRQKKAKKLLIVDFVLLKILKVCERAFAAKALLINNLCYCQTDLENRSCITTVLEKIVVVRGFFFVQRNGDNIKNTIRKFRFYGW